MNSNLKIELYNTLSNYLYKYNGEVKWYKLGDKNTYILDQKETIFYEDNSKFYFIKPEDRDINAVVYALTICHHFVPNDEINDSTYIINHFKNLFKKQFRSIFHNDNVKLQVYIDDIIETELGTDIIFGIGGTYEKGKL